MTTKNFRIFILFLSSALLVFSVKIILACGWYEETSNIETSVFAPEIIKQEEKTPFFFSPHIYYTAEGMSTPETIPTLTDRNTAEWIVFFENRLSKEDVEWLIYNSTLTQLETLKKGMTNKKINIDTLNQRVVKALKKQKYRDEIIDYIMLAKSSEKYFNPDYSSWDPLVYDSTSIQQLVPLCMERFKNTRQSFIKQRYGFQVTRALSVSGRYEECVQFYDTTFNPPVSAAGMYYRSLGYKARSLYKLQQYSLSNYLYACLYNNDPCQRYMAYQSFHPMEEADWNATLRLAKNSAETEAMWELFGLYNAPVKAMKELYAINPQSNSLPLLLVRAINITEEQLLQNPAKYHYMYTDFYPADYKTDQQFSDMISSTNSVMDTETLNSLSEIMRLAITERKTNKPAVWQLAGAYFSLLRRDYKQSSEILEKMSVDKNDSLLQGQAAIIHGILAVRKLEHIDAKAESAIYDHIEKISVYMQPALRKENGLRYMMSRLSMLYSNQNDLLKKELTYAQGQAYYFSSKRTQDMIDFMNWKNHNALEKYLVSKYPLNLKDLHEIKAVALMYEYNFKEAANEFLKSSDSNAIDLAANPFTIHINDCHDCDEAAQKKTSYSRYSFTKKMVELKSKGDTAADNESRAQNYFLYANAVYNMTWYGNSRSLHGTKASRDDYNAVVYGKNLVLLASNFFKCKEALAYYQKAFAMSNNKEFKAKCTWMSAKCEHNLWLDDRKEDDQRDFIAGRYFQQMKTGFENTQYYKEVIKECGYFCTYTRGGDDCKRNR